MDAEVRKIKLSILYTFHQQLQSYINGESFNRDLSQIPKFEQVQIVAQHFTTGGTQFYCTIRIIKMQLF